MRATGQPKRRSQRRLTTSKASESTQTSQAKRPNRFDFLLSTILFPFDVAPFLPLLRQDSIFVNVGAPGVIAGVSGGALWNQRCSIAWSCSGGMPQTQEVFYSCCAKAIRPRIELIRPDQIDESYLRFERKNVRNRFVIDLASDRTG
ncbi:MAG: hypothetical protein M3Y22_05190 [Pseudomonadota bacterium]|nr:hypothetical protein [Pseudomonadota bacterium]